MGAKKAVFGIILCVFAGVFSASYTSSQDGSWTNAATWGGGGTPGSGDDATINHTVGLSGSVTVGDNTNSVMINPGARLNMVAGSTLNLRGKFSANDCRIRLRENCTLKSDNGIYEFEYTNVCTLLVYGLDGNRSYFGGNGSDVLYVDGNGSSAVLNVSANYCDFVDMGNGTYRSFDIHGNGNYQSITFTNCLFKNISRFDYANGFPPSQSSIFKLLNSDFRDMFSGYFFVAGSGADYQFDDGTHVINNCTFYGSASGATLNIRFGNSVNSFKINNSIFGGIHHYARSPVSFVKCSFIHDRGNQTVVNFNQQAGRGYINRSLMWGNKTNIHFVSSTGTGMTAKKVLSFSEEPSAYGNHYLPGEATGLDSIVQCVCINDNPVVIRNNIPNDSVIIKRLTHINSDGLNADHLGIIESPFYTGSFIMYSSLHHSTNPRYSLFNDEVGGNSLSSNSYIDYNACYDTTFANRYSVTMIGKTLGEPGFGASDVGNDPQFRGDTARIRSWDVYNGGPGNKPHAFQEMFELNGFDTLGNAAMFDNDYSTIKALQYFKKAFSPQAQEYSGTGLNGDDIGAVDFVDNNTMKFVLCTTVVYENATKLIKEITHSPSEIIPVDKYGREFYEIDKNIARELWEGFILMADTVDGFQENGDQVYLFNNNSVYWVKEAKKLLSHARMLEEVP